jgi:hypothetical protein
MKLIPLFCIVFLTSCAPSLKPALTDSRRASLEVTLSKLDGSYSIYSLTRSTDRLDEILLFNIHRFKKAPDSSAHVVLKSVDDQHIRATLYYKDSIIKTRILTGRIKGDYFEFTSRSIFHFWVVVNVIGVRNGRIGLLKGGDLITESMYKAFLCLIFVPVNGGDEHLLEQAFKRTD